MGMDGVQIAQIAAGGWHSLALTGDGKVPFDREGIGEDSMGTTGIAPCNTVKQETECEEFEP